ncbi:MAG: DUF1080 domain-containing protein [Pirellulaceae bacterium]|jgi:hypothetical protein|nr:DUF1080 domain-containing protein [Pirellulaceae bacterium]MDP7019628.1 DUF1080 domain-containing protein [Pirellulaceae bacterium]
MRNVLLIFVIAAITVSPAWAEPPKGDGWQTLFNGKDLSGWTLKLDDPKVAEGIWTVKDGVIDCQPKLQPRGDKSLYTKRAFGDYQLHVEWLIKDTPGFYDAPVVLPDGSYKLDGDGKRITKRIANADSGIYNRGFSKAQVNIWRWPIGSGEVYGYRNDAKQSAAVRAGVTPKVNADRGVGEWNTFLLTMKGDRLTVVLNDKKVLDKAQLPGIPSRGPIALQHHGGFDAKAKKWNGASSLVQFRNIYIKEL